MAPQDSILAQPRGGAPREAKNSSEHQNKRAARAGPCPYPPDNACASIGGDLKQAPLSISLTYWAKPSSPRLYRPARFQSISGPLRPPVRHSWVLQKGSRPLSLQLRAG